MLLFFHFFGSAPDNYGWTHNGNFIVEGHGSGKEAASPFLASTQGKRFAWVSEVPKHKNLQIDLLKQYCEQHGAPITCRKLYKAPVSFRPTGFLVATSNYAMSVTNKDDDGFMRRARIWETTQTFKTKPTKLTEQKGDDTLKGKITSGYYNAQLLWLVRGLWATLAPDVNPGTVLQPAPKFMKELEDISSAGGSQIKVKNFIEKYCKHVERKDATKIAELKKVLAEFLCVEPNTIGPILTAIGVDSRGVCNTGHVRIAYHPHKKEIKCDGKDGVVTVDGMKLVPPPDGHYCVDEDVGA